jgi:alpha-methylacyl-CoA racemase
MFGRPVRSSAGPLEALRVIEVAAIGPAPLAGMLLADLGADVIRVDRPPTGTPNADTDLVHRGKRSVVLDLKQSEDLESMRLLIAGADVLIEGFRPGVMERLGLGPDVCAVLNPRLVYGRVTGWGQTGPLAQMAGHDINYIALTGALWATGRAGERPVFPLNLLGDYAGGSMFLLFGVLAALHERSRSGRGQVVDAAMVDGVSALTTLFWSLREDGSWRDARGSGLLDSGCPHYEVYECADGKYLSVGALEERFYQELVKRTGFREGESSDRRFRQPSPEEWPAVTLEWAALFRTRSRDEWARRLSFTDSCAQPVLDWGEAQAHPHLAARRTLASVDGVMQPQPAPRFSETPAVLRGRPPHVGEHTHAVLAELNQHPPRMATS